ncbi:hypothetical protein [Maribacter ulvicola]|uniref:Lipoprotein n=1 Tax=Maribacter ulvicola TaxID=228959 RepID=A0A1N6WIF8_9FLAO|nr:hypothetical protein [Maribacter ulvicola]SIQ89766.1 hypothetical protein SAMN05421797_10495 [Maribacter ulvicola]
MKNHYYLLALSCLLLTNCAVTKTLKFSQKDDDIIRTESLKHFLNENKNPKVVLRVNESSMNVTEEDNNDYLFNAIENQLLSSGFIVRDRQLFNQIIENDENNIDYKQLKEKSDTDLIIELTKLNPQVMYETNKYYDQKNRERIELSHSYQKYGASVEFKVVVINSNEFAGVYKFNYTPCTNGCVISKSMSELRREREKKANDDKKGYEGVERNELEIFIKNATKQLVTEMRN